MTAAQQQSSTSESQSAQGGTTSAGSRFDLQKGDLSFGLTPEELVQYAIAINGPTFVPIGLSCPSTELHIKANVQLAEETFARAYNYKPLPTTEQFMGLQKKVRDWRVAHGLALADTTPPAKTQAQAEEEKLEQEKLEKEQADKAQKDAHKGDKDAKEGQKTPYDNPMGLPYDVPTAGSKSSQKG